MLAGTFLAVLDSSILNISVVPMLREFKVSLGAVEWVLTAYNIAFAVLLIPLGRLGDLGGRRRVFLGGQALFVVGSALAGIARGPLDLALYRALQGVGAAGLAPNALALILETFPDDEHGKVVGVWGAAAGLGGALGPTVGAMIAAAFGWRAVFLLNIPVGLLLVGAAAVVLPRERRRRLSLGQLDLPGFAALTALIALVSVALLEWPRLVWDLRLAAGIALLAAALGVLFVLQERRAAHPLLDLALLRVPGVLAANVAIFFALIIMAGGMFVSVLYGQLLGGVSPVRLGLLLAPCAAATFLLATPSGVLCDRVGARRMAAAGMVLLVLSVLLPALWHPALPDLMVALSNLFAGAGLGIATPALVRTATESVARDHTGVASGVYKTMNELGGVFGVAVLGTLLETRITANALLRLPGHLVPADLSLKAVASLGDLEAHAIQKGLGPDALPAFHRSLVEAMIRGFDQVFWIATAVALLGLATATLLPSRRARRSPAAEGGEGR